MNSNLTLEQQVFIDNKKLSDEELEQSIETIIARSFCLKNPEEKPVAFIVGGQPGSGKGGIIANIMNNYGTNYILVDNDDYRKYHPDVDEINSIHPEIYTECTDQLSFAATPRVIDFARQNNYNMIIHQTLKNDKIINCAMTDLANSGYVCVVMVMAADKMTSNEGMLRRCQDQLAIDGTCRWVPQENHDIAYNGLPLTVGKIEASGLYDAIIVVTRSDDSKHPENVNVIHRVYNPNISGEHKQTLNSIGMNGDQINKYGSAMQAVFAGRKMDADKVLDGLAEKISIAKEKAQTNEELLRVSILEGIFEEEQSKRMKGSF